MMGRVLGIGLLAAVAALGAAAVWVRVAPLPAQDWHADPLAAERPNRPNHALIRPGGGDAAAPVWPMAPGALMAALDRVAMTEPRVARLAGSVEDGWVTYVARSQLWGFPDLVSVRALPAGDGTTLAAFGRARFGYSDMGVNRARLDRWIAALPPPD